MEKKTSEAYIISRKDQKFVWNFGLKTEGEKTNARVSGRREEYLKKLECHDVHWNILT
jgi:hypothetical protein